MFLLFFEFDCFRIIFIRLVEVIVDGDYLLEEGVIL